MQVPQGTSVTGLDVAPDHRAASRQTRLIHTIPTETTMHKFLALAALLAALPAAVPAQAQERDVRTVTVDYSDLNLSAPAGIAALRHRLSIASRNVCGENDGRELAVTADMLACRDASLKTAMADFSQVQASAQSRHSTVVASIAPN